MPFVPVGSDRPDTVQTGDAAAGAPSADGESTTPHKRRTNRFAVGKRGQLGGDDLLKY